MSPGLAKMTYRAAAAVPFAAAAKLVGELAGIPLTGKRAGRRAEADGQAAARVIEAQAAAITARTLVPLLPARRCRTCCISRFMPRRRLCRLGVRWPAFAVVSGPGAADLLGIITGWTGRRGGCRGAGSGPGGWRAGWCGLVAAVDAEVGVHVRHH